MILTTWAQFKSICITTKQLPIQYVEAEGGYQLVGPDANNITWEYIMPKKIQDPENPSQVIDNPEVTEFLADVAPTANQDILSNVRTEPSNVYQMQADAVSATIPHGTTGTIDFKIQNYGDEAFTTKYLAGAEVFVTNATAGDYAESQIIDIDNVLGYGANLVLKTYVRKKYLFPSVKQTIIASAPGAIPVGLYIRVVYHSVGTETDPTIYINYDIEIKG